jgi:hypothetical protein
MESFEVLGVFGKSHTIDDVLDHSPCPISGWFFGDFFMEDFPAHLEYTGIYR